MTLLPRSHKPLIGVTGPDRGGDAAWLFTWLQLALTGASAVRITPHRHANARIVDELDGLIIGGGADVDPKLYGQELLHMAQAARREEPVSERILNWVLLPLTWLIRKASACCVSPRADAARDQLEMRLLDRAVSRRIPILGICRGGQLINVYFGGSLYQNLKGFYVEDPALRTILPRKRIAVTHGSRLAAAIGQRPGRVNALHAQAIHRIGQGLLVAARDRNGIVQAIEHATMPFIIGVQWHPEFLPQLAAQRKLFRALVVAASQSFALTAEAEPTHRLRIAG